MVTKRQENFIFSIESAAIFDYDTGEPFVVRQFAGLNATLNAAINVALLEGADVNSTKRVEIFGGAYSFDVTVKEAPMELINAANAGTLASAVACASATVTQIDDRNGTLSAFVTSIAVSGGATSTVVHDTIYVKALSTSTLEFTNYSKGTKTTTLTASGASRLVDSTVMPGIIMTLASGFVSGATATFTTIPIHTGKKTSTIGTENTTTNNVFVGIKGVAQSKASGDKWQFTLHKCLMTGIANPMNHGDFMEVTVHGDAQIDDSLSTPAAGEMLLLKG